MADAPPSAPPAEQKEEAKTASDAKAPSPESASSVPTEASPSVEETLPLREDFIQNAVKFLSHPKVQGSPVQYRRSFLEKKGLNSAEITEAFRRVPDAASASSALPSTTTVTTTTTHPTPAPAPPPSAAPQPGAVPRKPWEQSTQPAATYAAPSQQMATAQPQQAQAQLAPRQGMRWTQMVLALGVLSAAGAGTVLVTKNYLVPRLRTWLRRWLLDISEEAGGVRKLTPVEEAAIAAAAAATAAAEATKVMKEAREEVKEARTESDRKLEAILAAFQGQTRELTATLDSLKTALEDRETARKEALILGTASHPEAAPPVSLPDLRKELLKFASVVTGFTGTPAAPDVSGGSAGGLFGADVSELKALVQERRAAGQVSRAPAIDQEYDESEDGLNWLQPSQTATQNGDLSTARYETAPKGPANSAVDRRALGTTAGGRAGPANQGLAMQPASAAMEPRYAGANGSLDGSRPMSASSMPLSQAVPSQDLPHRPNSSPARGPDHAPHSKSYMDVLQMLQEGKPIPGIRDIDDKPPNPNQPPTDPKLKPRAKPWEKGFQQVSEKPASVPAPPPFNVTNARGGSSSAPVYSSDGQAPWWRKPQPVSQPSVGGAQPAQDGYFSGGSANGADEFVHPALAGDIEPPRTQPVQPEPAGASSTGESSSASRFTEAPPQLPETQAASSQSGPSSGSRSTVAAGGFQEQGRQGVGTSASVVPSKPAWRPPAVPGFAMPSAAEAIKGKGKLVPVTPMAPTGQREGQVARNGVVHVESSEWEKSSQSASGDSGEERDGQSRAPLVEAGASMRENDGEKHGENVG